MARLPAFFCAPHLARGELVAVFGRRQASEGAALHLVYPTRRQLVPGQGGQGGASSGRPGARGLAAPSHGCAP